MARPRSRKNAGLPSYLYVQNGYYYYRHPISKQVFGLGRNKAQAVTQTVEANLKIQGEAVTLWDKISGEDKRTVNAWCDEYERLNGTPDRMKYLRAGLGDHILEKLMPLQIDEWLDKNWKDKLRMRQAMLSTTSIVLGAAIGKGWLTHNPAADLKTPPPVTIRDRLSLEDFFKIYEKAQEPLKRAMELAMMTCARRQNLITAKWSHIQDGYLHVAHVKAKVKLGEEPMKVRYPLSMYLPELKLTLGDVIGRCRDNVVSPFLIHHRRHQGQAKPGHKFRDKTIEQWFREAREAAGVIPAAGRTPPTLHEIKSLAKMLWHKHGYDTMTMCGHKTDAMDALYRDRRGKDWLTVEIAG